MSENTVEAIVRQIHGSGETSELIAKYCKKVYIRINQLRALHDSPRLLPKNELFELANERAKYLEEEKLFYWKTGPGEAYWVGCFDMKDSLLHYWYGGIQNYPWEEPKHTKHSENFATLIWKGSTDIGIGVQIIKSSKQLKDSTVAIVAMFEPMCERLDRHIYSQNINPAVLNEPAPEENNFRT